MPTVAGIGPYRFFFFAGDRAEPRHVHVERDEKNAKFWLDPVNLASNRGFRSHELTVIRRLVEENRDFFTERWNAYFGGQQ